MKAPNEVATEGRGPARGALLGMLALVIYLPACLGDCFLDDSGIVSDRYRYDCRATIQAADGTRSEVSTDNLMEFAGAEAPIFAAPLEAPAYVREDWLRYLRRILEERSGDEAFRAVYGTGPWCVIGQPELAPTEVLISWDATGVANETGPELDFCSCGEDCGNPEGVVPILEVSPATPGTPHRVDFGSAPVGSPVVREVELTNSGDGRLCLNPPSIHATSPHPDDFVLAPLSGCELTPEGLLVLEGTQVCRFRVTFTPRQAGLRSALVPGARGCGDYITLAGIGSAGQLSASPAPACFLPPSGPDPCSEVPIRIDNMSPAAVSLISTSVSDSTPDGWYLAAIETSDGVPIALPYALPPGEFVNARMRACALATAENALRVMHNGMDYGAPGSPTGDVDPGSPLVIRVLPPTSGCTP